MNRPEVLNAFNIEMARALAEACEKIQKNTEIRCMVIKGSGANFMAGGDVPNFKKAMDSNDEGYVKELIIWAHTSISLIREMEIPVIASVEGAVAGYGLSLLLACDLAIASETSKYLVAYSLLGANPDGGLTFHLPRCVGTKKAYELCLFNEQLNAHQAYEIGIVNRIVAPQKLKEETEKIAEKIANGPQKAYGRIKQLLNQSLGNTLSEQLSAERNGFLDGFGTDEFTEGVNAYCEKRKAVFM